jgi:hypothetical protein
MVKEFEGFTFQLYSYTDHLADNRMPCSAKDRDKKYPYTVQ